MKNADIFIENNTACTNVHSFLTQLAFQMKSTSKDLFESKFFAKVFSYFNNILELEKSGLSHNNPNVFTPTIDELKALID